MYQKQNIHVKANFSEKKHDFGDRKGHQLPKSICFLNCVFLPCYLLLYYTALLAHGQSRAVAWLPTYPTAFHSLRHGWQKRKKLVKPLQAKGLLLSGWLCDISGDNHNKRQITARFTVSDKLAHPRTALPLPRPPKICVSKRERDHATVWRQRARATRHLVTETAPALELECWQS